MRVGFTSACLVALVIGGAAYFALRTRADAAAETEAAAEAHARAKAEADARAAQVARAKAAAKRHVEVEAPMPSDPEAPRKASGLIGVNDASIDDPIDEIAIENDLPVFVVRARPGTGRARTVFLTGSCTHPSTYVREFRRAAAEHGGIVALQGDLPCRAGNGLRRWSPDAVGTSARIDAALRAAGIEETGGITVVGYSQGAERAEWLAHRFPTKYTRFVLMAGPVVPGAARFAGAESVVTLAGYGDVRENMADGAKRMRRAAIPAIYMELPGGSHHGELAPEADAVVAKAFDWLEENASVTPRPNRRVRARRPAEGPRRSLP
jgi:pimeloyl-ACP methyl ester carboxylesterase